MGNPSTFPLYYADWEAILTHEINPVPNPIHDRVFARQRGSTHVGMVMVTHPYCDVFAVPHLGFYLGSLPSGQVLLRLDLFVLEPLTKALGHSTAYRVFGLLVFGSSALQTLLGGHPRGLRGSPFQRPC